ncbi:MAG: flagellar basal body P-ring formation chaperone FlgA [Geminicoccaceae bacterium]
MLRDMLCGLMVLALTGGAVLATELPGKTPLTEAFAKRLVIETMYRSGGIDDLEVVIDQPRLPLGNQESAATTITLEGLRRDEATGRFSGVLVGMVDATPRFQLPLEGRLQQLVTVAVLGRPVARGEPIAAADLDWIDVPSDGLSPGSVIDADQLIGAEARRGLRPGRVLTERDIGSPRLVRRGQSVRVIYVEGGLKLSLVGKARDDGALGDPIRIVNPESNLQIRGIATGPSEVTVGAAARPARRSDRAGY